MSSIFFALAIVSASVALFGFIWSTVVGLRSRREAIPAADEARRATVAGADAATVAEVEAAVPLADNGRASPVAFSLGAVGRQIREVGWRPALPGLLMATGLLSLLVFGGLALLVSLPSKLFGIAAVAIAVYVLVTELRSIHRALRE